MRLKSLALLAVPLILAATACAPKDDEATDKGGPTSCKPADLPVKTDGKLTIATDTPAFSPWFVDNDPANGKGFESAVAYAVAGKLGFDKAQVSWIKEPFNNSYAPGEKKFDFDINQVSITPERAKAVDFSTGYYSAAQAVVALEKKKLDVGSLDDLKDLKLGAQTGTTSLTAVRDVIKPTQPPLVFPNSNVPKQALLNGQVDAVVFDLPTAFYITAAEIEGSTIVGQFQPTTATKEEFGLLMQKGSGLKSCVDKALASLKDDGTLADLEQKWLSTTVDVPVLK